MTPVAVHIRLFAAARQLAGADTAQITCPGPVTIAKLREALRHQHPTLAPLLDHLRFAVNAQYVADDAVVNAQDEIACIPPVSGG